MPRIVGPFSLEGGTMSISAGSFFGSALYVPASGLPSPPSLKVTLPSEVNVRVVPGGGFSGLPLRTPVSPTHAPTSVGGSLAGASFLAGAATTRARPTSRGVRDSILLGALEGEEYGHRPVWRGERLRPFAHKDQAESERILFELEDAE